MFGRNQLQWWPRVALVFLFMVTAILIAGCAATPEENFTPVTQVPTAVATELPVGVQTARDAVLAYVTANYNISVSPSETNWRVNYITPQRILGIGTFRLSADNCELTISYPLVAADSTIYHVTLDDSETAFHWEGDVDAQGKVLVPTSWEETAVSASDTINIVELADLHNTVGIEICRLDCASYTPLFTLGNPEQIANLIDALDTDMPLKPQARCPATYQLRFIQSDGQHYDFGYTCQMMTPTFLRGNQAFWQGQDAVAPDAFNELMLPLIAPVFGDEY